MSGALATALARGRRGSAALAAAVLGTALLASSHTPAATAAAPEARTSYTAVDTVSGWGGFDAGQTTRPRTLATSDVVAVTAAGSHSLALTATGRVVGWGDDDDGQVSVPRPLDDGTWRARAIDTSDHHSVAVLDDGSVVAWGARGDTDAGQALVPAAYRPGSGSGARVLDVSAGRTHTLAVVDEGGRTVVRAWGAQTWHGDIDEGQATAPAALADGRAVAVDVAAGARHSLAVDDQGRVWAWGLDSQGQTDVPAELTGQQVVAVAAYGYTSMALTASGRVVAWGDDGTGTTEVSPAVRRARVVAIDLGSELATARTADGHVLTWGDTATPVPAGLARHAPFTDVAAGEHHVLVVHRLPKDVPTLKVTAPARVTVGRAVTVRVRLGGAETGPVVLYDGARRLGTVAVRADRGTAAADAVGVTTVRGLRVGTHRLTARRAGTAWAEAAASPAAVVRVRR